MSDEIGEDDYSILSRDQLIEEIKKLKKQVKKPTQGEEAKTIRTRNEEKTFNNSNEATRRRKIKGDNQQNKKAKELDFADHSQRKIALTLSYQGTEHGGLAWQPEVTPRSTVEGELFKALLISRLVERKKTDEILEPVDFNQPEHLIQSVDMDKWGYSRAGRTDSGVSGSGQVVSLWVRSRLKSAPSRFGFKKKSLVDKQEVVEEDKLEKGSSSEQEEWHESIKDELGYHTMLNAILPSSVRVLAWSPVSEHFDARFSCQARHYKYFFSLYENPLGPPLNIHAMRLAAQKLVGDHDFRNFCKVDPSKQINNFHRKIIFAHINPVQEFHHHHHHDHHEDDNTLITKTHQDGVDFLKSHSVQSNPIFVLDLMGTAFLYNMVRHIVSILFLIGTGLETVDIIDRMFYTERGENGREKGSLDPAIEEEPVECKPEYVHANALPLLFYRSIYPEGTFHWIPTPSKAIKPCTSDLFTTWSKDRIRAILSYHHLKAHDQFIANNNYPTHSSSYSSSNNNNTSFFQPLGAAELRPSTRYLPVLDRPRGPHFSVINANWWNKIGAQKLAKRQLGRLS